MTTEERVIQPDDSRSDDEVARLVRLAGTSGPIAAERLARVRTAVHGAWRDEYVARQAKTRRRRLTVAVLLAAAASVVIAFAIWGPIRTPAPVPAPVLVAHIDQATGSPAPFHGRRCGDVRFDGHDIRRHAGHDAHERRASQAGRLEYRPRGLSHRRRARAWCRVCGLGWRASHPAGRVSDQHPHAGGTRA